MTSKRMMKVTSKTEVKLTPKRGCKCTSKRDLKRISKVGICKPFQAGKSKVGILGPCRYKEDGELPLQ